MLFSSSGIEKVETVQLNIDETCYRSILEKMKKKCGIKKIKTRFNLLKRHLSTTSEKPTNAA